MDHTLLSTQYDENGTVIHTIPVTLIKTKRRAPRSSASMVMNIFIFRLPGLPTDYNAYADVNYQYTDLNEFNSVLLDTTILQPFLTITTRDIKRTRN